jgi:hypothetical protein
MSNPESKPEHGFIYPPEKIMGQALLDEIQKVGGCN